MKKRIRLAALFTLLALALCGCGGEEPISSDSSQTAPSVETPTASSSMCITGISISDNYSDDDSVIDVDGSEQITTINSNDYDLDCKQSSTWEEDGRFCGGYEVTLYNNTSSIANGWTVEFSTPQDFEIIASWNGDFSANGGTLSVKNVDYNADIPAGRSVNFGFNYSTLEEYSISDYTISINNVTITSTEQTTAAESTTQASTLLSATTEPKPAPKPKTDGETPVSSHGQLSVEGAQLVDQNGDAYQLRGMSTHGMTWFPDFVNKEAFKTLRDEWNTNVVRLAMYVDEWGNGQCYMNNKQGSKDLMIKGIDLCIELDMYVIVDWHLLNPGDPTSYTDEAIAFFKEITQKYADYPNMIYEICNEPNGDVSWSGKIKPYAETLIPIIRENDSDAVIIVGTPTWSQDIDAALSDPLDYDNVMYALHFYAATHTDWLRDRLTTCVNGGLPVFVSEFGCCDASGNGANDFAQTEKWLNLLDNYSISYCNWNLANKDEASSAFKSSAPSSGWSESDYSEGGKWIRDWFMNH